VYDTFPSQRISVLSSRPDLGSLHEITIYGVIVANYFDPWYINNFEEVYEYQEAAPMNRNAVITKIHQLMAYANVSASEL